MDAIGESTVPTIFGTNRDETRSFQSTDPAYVDMLFGKLPRIKDKAVYLRDAVYASDTWRLAGVDEHITRAGIEQRLAADARLDVPAGRRRLHPAVDGMLSAALREEESEATVPTTALPAGGTR